MTADEALALRNDDDEPITEWWSDDFYGYFASRDPVDDFDVAEIGNGMLAAILGFEEISDGSALDGLVRGISFYAFKGGFYAVAKVLGLDHDDLSLIAHEYYEGLHREVKTFDELQAEISSNRQRLADFLVEHGLRPRDDKRP